MDEDLTREAEGFVTAFMEEHKLTPIPELMERRVMWTVDSGGIVLVKGALSRLLAAAHDMESAQ